MLDTKISIAAVNRALDAALDPLDGGYLEIYDGAKPPSPDVPVTTQVKLAQCALSATAFQAAVAGVKTANGIGDGVGLAAGTPTWFRSFQTNDLTAVIDGTAGAIGTNLLLDASVIDVGDPISVLSWTVAQAQ